MNALTLSSWMSQVFLHPPFSNYYFHKTCIFAVENFYLLTNLSFSCVGIKEIVIEGKLSVINAVKEIASPNLLQRVYHTLLLTQDHSKEFFSLHGSFLLTSGALGVADALFNVGLFAALSQGLFVLACSIGLRFYAGQYNQAMTCREKSSAILGVLSCMGYILQVAFTAMGAPGAFVVLTGLFALTCVSIKFVIDFSEFFNTININSKRESRGSKLG